MTRTPSVGVPGFRRGPIEAVCPYVWSQVQNVLVKRGERNSGNGAGGGDGMAAVDDGKSPAPLGAVSPRGDKDGDGGGSGKGGGGGGAQQPAAKPKPKKDWVRFDGAAMLLSSAGWSDDEDEEKEELISSEIEKFRQKQVGGLQGDLAGGCLEVCDDASCRGMHGIFQAPCLAPLPWCFFGGC